MVLAVAAALYFHSVTAQSDIRQVVLISIDTCRADYLGCYGYSRPTTPNIDKLSEQAVLFENVVSPLPITLPSHCSIMTGTIPPYHGVRNNSDYKLAESNLTLAEVLRENAFATGAIVSAFVLDAQFGLDQGFDSYNDSFDEPVRNLLYFSERRGAEASRFAGQWLEKHKDDRFFMFLHYFDSHIKYSPPEPFASEFADNLYAGKIAYTDRCIGQVLEKLKELGLYDSALIIVTGDHGEMLGEYGEDTHTYFIYQSAIKVPLIFKLPGQTKARRISHLAGLIDVMPTVCSLLDVEPPPHVQGKDLSAYFGKKKLARQERYLYCESLTATRYDASALLGAVTNRFKYIQTTRPEFYDIVDDPRETKNLIEQQRQQARILQGQLEQILEQTAHKDNSSSKIELDEQSLKNLQSLGYMAGSVNEDFKLDQSKDDPKDLIDFHNTYTSISDLILEKQYEQAERLCQKLAANRPKVYQIYVLMASIARQQQDFAKAVLHLKRAIEVRPDVAKLPHYLGTILAEQGKFDEAADQLKKSLQIDPDQLAVHHELAAVLYEQKRFDEAISCLTEAIRLKPDSAKTFGQLGDAYAEKGDFREATKYFHKAVDMNPLDGENRSKLARALVFQQCRHEAIEQLKDGLRITCEHAGQARLPSCESSLTS